MSKFNPDDITRMGQEVVNLVLTKFENEPNAYSVAFGIAWGQLTEEGRKAAMLAAQALINED